MRQKLWDVKSGKERRLKYVVVGPVYTQHRICTQDMTMFLQTLLLVQLLFTV